MTGTGTSCSRTSELGAKVEGPCAARRARGETAERRSRDPVRTRARLSVPAGAELDQHAENSSRSLTKPSATSGCAPIVFPRSIRADTFADDNRDGGGCTPVAWSSRRGGGGTIDGAVMNHGTVEADGSILFVWARSLRPPASTGTFVRPRRGSYLPARRHARRTARAWPETSGPCGPLELDGTQVDGSLSALDLRGPKVGARHRRDPGRRRLHLGRGRDRRRRGAAGRPGRRRECLGERREVLGTVRADSGTLDVTDLDPARSRTACSTAVSTSPPTAPRSTCRPCRTTRPTWCSADREQAS